MPKPITQKLVLVLIGSTIVVLAILGLWKIPHWQVAPLQKQIDALKLLAKPADPEKIASLEKSRIDAENAARTVLVQGVGGFFVFVTAGVAWLNYGETRRNISATERNVKATEEKQLAERFAKAVELLGSKENILAQVAGIYALEQVANDREEKYYWQVMETLTFYVRERSPWKEGNLSEDSSDEAYFCDEGELSSISNNIQEALRILDQQRRIHQKGKDYRLNLSEVDLCRLRLTQEAQLCKVDFSHSNLQEAFLPEACLERANLSGANLKGAFLYRANLREADLQGANLQEAILIDADLTGAILSYAILREALLWKANLKDAELSDADLREAELGEFDCPYPGVDLQEKEFREFVWNRDSWLLKSELGFRRFEQISNNIENTSNVIFKGADLSNTTLKGAKLMEAKLQGAVFDGADLQYADLRQANVKEASFKGAKLKEAKFRADQHFVEQHKKEMNVFGLTWEQLDEADFYKKNCLPNHLLPLDLELEAARSTTQATESVQAEGETTATPLEETQLAPPDS